MDPNFCMEGQTLSLLNLHILGSPDIFNVFFSRVDVSDTVIYACFYFLMSLRPVTSPSRDL